ncbi:MAG: polyprenyl synthetase family protein [Myxococcales bacterium]|nr:polyprenyl synthetase family protein [Myxococcales bacterium]
MRHSVLNGGKRIRPRLLLATAEACNGGPMDEDTAELALRAAVAVELIHSASLVHDDLPCFDDASLRRGQPTVHCAYGEPMAVLAGDALITQAFEVLADYEGDNQRRALRLVRLLSQSTGSLRGIVGGQSLELHPERWIDGEVSMDLVADYHEKKTAALFDYSMRAAAIAVGLGRSHQDRWGEVGIKLGLAFQLIDDLLDLYMDETETGKTTGRDRALAKPNGALVEGSNETVRRLSQLIDEACGLIFELARKPDPVLRLMESFDSMLVKLEGTMGAGDSQNLPAESGIFTARVAVAGVA